jgi:hypothetical protein
LRRFLTLRGRVLEERHRRRDRLKKTEGKTNGGEESEEEK